MSTEQFTSRSAARGRVSGTLAMAVALALIRSISRQPGRYVDPMLIGARPITDEMREMFTGNSAGVGVGVGAAAAVAAPTSIALNAVGCGDANDISDDSELVVVGEQSAIGDVHYVCDIAMMRIVDEGATNTNSNSAATTTTTTTTTSKDNHQVNSRRNNNYINNGGGSNADVEIDRNEEAQTVNELVRSTNGGALMEANNNGSVRLVFGILVRLVLPLANGVARGIKGIRDVRVLRVLQNLASSRQALTNLVAFAANTISLNLSSVQVSNRLGPLLNLIKLRKMQDGLESLPDTMSVPTTPTASTPGTPIIALHPAHSPLPLFGGDERQRKGRVVNHEPMPSRCCTLDILAEPEPGMPIRADIVFMHGLHGSLVNTWKQGLWENDRQPVEFERPPQPPVRPPKRPRHSRSATPYQAPRQKRAKFASSDRSTDRDVESNESVWDQSEQQQFVSQPFSASQDDDDDDGDGDGDDPAFVCGGPEDIQISEGLEYSFPTFRLRMNAGSRLLQAELESMLRIDSNGNSKDQQTATNYGDEFSPSTATTTTTGDENDDENITKRKKGEESSSSSTKKPPSSNDPNYSKCWPGDWLPLDCPGVRVLAINYTTDQYLWRPLWKGKEPRSSLQQRSREMAELLIQHRVGYGHPIIYVGHSKGGLFIKQLIVDAWESGRPAMTPLWRSARGCFFYSVPHRGSHLANIKAPLLSRSVELLEIEKNNKYLLDLHRRFTALYYLGHLKIEVFSFVETALTLMSVLFLRIVGVDSADPGIGDVCGIRLDHREICKPRSRDCILYKELVKMIKKVCG